MGLLAVVDPELCNNCGQCVVKCDEGAIEFPPISIDQTDCNGCGACALECPTNAIVMVDADDLENADSSTDSTDDATNGKTMPPEYTACVAAWLKDPKADKQRAEDFCLNALKTIYKQDANGNWVKLPVEVQNEDKDVNIELAFKPETHGLEGTKQETIDAIKSVRSIRAKDRIIGDLPDSARFIKGYPVITSGTFNGLYYPDDMLQRDAQTFIENDKPGMTKKSKFGHKTGVEARVAHITNSYYEDGFIKQDFLILNKEAIEKWDQGFLDDVSIRAKGKIDMANSTPGRVILKSIVGRGTDFVDQPACTTCGLDAVLAELEMQNVSAEPDTVEVENMAPVLDLRDDEVEDNDMVEEVDMKTKILDFFEDLFKAKTEEPVEEPVEEVIKTEPVEEVIEEPVAETVPEVPIEPSSADFQVAAPVAAVALEDDVDMDAKVKEYVDLQLAEVKAGYEERIVSLENELKESKAEVAQTKTVELQNELKELGSKFKIELSEEDIEKMDDIALSVKIDTYKEILRSIPEGSIPKMMDIVLEEEKQSTDLEAECAEIDEKRQNICVVGSE